MKCPNPDDDPTAAAESTKRRKIHHQLLHKQQSEAGPLPGPQNHAFYGAQLIRAISLALVAVGFDSVKPTALESFRAEVEEYMLHFLSLVRASMLGSRRSQPVAQDFLFALAELGLEESSLVNQLKTGVPPSIAQPPIGPPPPDDEQPHDLEYMLGLKDSQAEGEARRWIPEGFPSFPGKNTWKATPVYTSRETDPCRIREKATEEGMLAEQALRDLMAAAKEGQQHRDETSLRRTTRKQKGHQLWEAALGSMLKADENLRRKDVPMSFGFDFGDGGTAAADTAEHAVTAEPQSEGPLLVNYDRKFWRKATEAAF